MSHLKHISQQRLWAILLMYTGPVGPQITGVKRLALQGLVSDENPTRIMGYGAHLLRTAPHTWPHVTYLVFKCKDSLCWYDCRFQHQQCYTTGRIMIRCYDFTLRMSLKKAVKPGRWPHRWNCINMTILLFSGPLEVVKETFTSLFPILVLWQLL